MADENDREFNWSNYERFGSPSEKQAYLSGKAGIMTEYEGRLRALETSNATTQQTLAQIQAEQAAARAEQNQHSSRIESKLEAMSLASARATGAQEEVAKQAQAAVERTREARENVSRQTGQRQFWLGLAAGPLLGLALWGGSHFVRDVVAWPPLPQAAP